MHSEVVVRDQWFVKLGMLRACIRVALFLYGASVGRHLTAQHFLLFIRTAWNNDAMATLCAETLDSKMNWLKNYERIQEIQQQIVWKSISEVEPRSFVPGVRICNQLLLVQRIRDVNRVATLVSTDVSQSHDAFSCCVGIEA